MSTKSAILRTPPRPSPRVPVVECPSRTLSGTSAIPGPRSVATTSSPSGRGTTISRPPVAYLTRLVASSEVARTTRCTVRLGQRPGVAGGDEHPGPPVVEDPAERVEPAGDDRGPGCHRLGEDHAEALPAAVRGTVDVRAAQGAGLGGVVDLAEQVDPVGQLRAGLPVQRLGLTPADHQQPQVGQPGSQLPQRVQQHPHALARLGEPADEPDRAARARIPGQRPGRGEQRRVHPVRDLDGVPTQVLDLDPACQRGDRDPGGDLLQQRAQHGFEGRQGARPRGGRVEGRHDRPLSELQREQGQARRRGLVQVQHVEVGFAQPPPDPGVGDRAELQPRHGPVVRDAQRPPGRLYEVRQVRSVLVPGREDGHRVPERPQRPRQVPHVPLHSTGHVEGVRADDPDSHAAPVLTPRAPARAPRSGRPPRTSAACASRSGARRCRRRTRPRPPGSRRRPRPGC